MNEFEPDKRLQDALRLTDIELRGDRGIHDPHLLKKLIALLKCTPDDILAFKVLRRSLDRRPRPPRTRYNVAIKLKDRAHEDKLLKTLPKRHKARRMKEDEHRVLLPQTPEGHSLIVGAGPAGLSLAWALCLQGRQVTLLERGFDVHTRTRDVGRFFARGQLNSESNICFGEGGAGTFSDGKLVTRSQSPYRDFFMQTLVRFGAPSTILQEAQAHVGSDKLRKIVKAWRQEMVERGVTIRFGAKVTDLITESSKVTGVVVNDQEKICADRVFFAVGGHARDSLELLHRHQVKIEPRGLAVGVRIEHPQKIINKALAGYEEGPACEYRLKTQIDDRGVYSFCMCPGGVVVAAASSQEHQVVNGMSFSGKKSPFANSALVVTVSPDSFPPGPLGGLAYQSRIEQKAYEATGSFEAPAQRLEDFRANRPSTHLGRSTYRPGLKAVNLRDILPADISYHLLQALPQFERKLPGYLDDDALLIGVETRTSCPLQVIREPNLNATLENFYCVGEGAGFSGGILSSAFDALAVLNGIAQRQM